MRIVDIVTCPDKLKLAFCLLEGDNKNQTPVLFKVKEKDNSHEWSEYVKLNSIEREDGSGYSYNLTGWNTANNCKVKIFISVTRRTGTMTFVV